MKIDHIQDIPQVLKTLINAPQGLVLSPDEGEKRVRRWGYPFLIKVDGQNGNAEQFTVGSEKIAPGKSVHVHKHDEFEELLIIMAGRGTVLLDDKYYAVESGSLIFIPKQVWHGIENTGTADIELLWIFPQLGMEQYFRATSVSIDGKNSPLSQQEMNNIRAQHRKNVIYREESLKNYTNQTALTKR